MGAKNKRNQRKSLGTTSSSESSEGTVILYRSPIPSDKEAEDMKYAKYVPPSSPKPGYKEIREKNAKLKRILRAVYDVDPDPRIPSRRQLSQQFWERRFQKTNSLQQSLSDSEDSGEELSDDEAMRRPRRPVRGKKMRRFKNKKRTRPLMQTFLVDENGEKYWYLDRKGKVIRCLFGCCEGFIGEIRVYTFFILTMIYLGTWIFIYGTYATSWSNRVKPFPIGTWQETYTYPHGGPTTTRTITGHIITFDDPKRTPTGTATETPDFVILTTPNIQIWN
ncbi:hypothetical protein TWF718_005864 [Orbilia javanica]|uniref:Uncharacterized protein n=1 Tax=Orbilia javanica TaxID=47235 RepID=A0AAN8MVR8_9PEZI